MYDPLVAFLVGMLAGLILGIVVASIMAATANNIERRESSNDK